MVVEIVVLEDLLVVILDKALMDLIHKGLDNNLYIKLLKAKIFHILDKTRKV
jgi:hypothetical protein